jgi:excisionase family DNA binding protein
MTTKREDERMSQAKTKPQKSASPVEPVVPDVLTLGEAAAYLRVTEDQVLRLVRYQDLPARLLDTEWRFLKLAIQDWLRTTPPRGSREAVLSVAGAWKDDPLFEEELKEFHKQRGRPITEDGE